MKRIILGKENFFLPNHGICIMLSLFIKRKWMHHHSFALLLAFSCITFHTIVSAGITEDTAEKYRSLGYAEQQKGNIDQALSYYIKATTLGVDNAALLNDMGVLYEDIDFNTKAAHYYSKAIKKDEQYLPAYINLAYLYKKMGRVDEAAWYFKMRYELGNPTDPWAQKAKEELLKLKPEYQSWARDLEASALSSELIAKSKDEFYERVERSQQHFQKGEQLFNQDLFEEAMTEFNRAIQLAPNNPKIQDARKRTLIELTKEKINSQSEQAIKMLEAGDTSSARHEIQKILTAIPEEPLLISR